MKTIKNNIKNGIDFLKLEYKNNNHFGFETLFPAVLIADCLNQIKTAKDLNKKLIKSIFTERSIFCSFNYWYEGTNKHKNEPYPDDLDDTFCALSAIFRFNKKLIKGDDLAKIINLLILCEENEGGPYRTWVIPKEKSRGWDDVDIAVNSNVAYFLKLNDIELENINSLIESKIKSNELISPFYRGELPIIYFISRFYNGNFKKFLTTRLLIAVLNASNLEIALIISSLLRLKSGNKIKKSWVEKLLNGQNNDGSWPEEGFYIHGKKIIGSKTLSTAFVLEALTLWNNKEKKRNNLNVIKQKIYNKAEENLNYLPIYSKSPVLEFLRKTFDNDKNGIITLTPVITFLSLKNEHQNKINEDFLIKLGIINLYGWCAYTIYDDIVDGDSKVNRLTLANIFCREMDAFFNNLEIDKSTGFFEFYKKTMQGVENANYWESNNLDYDKNCIKSTFINTDNLSDKSLGHALTSIAILCKLGFKTESNEVQKMIGFFKNFLIARQMNDDMHDWEKDLEKGKINSASSELFNLIGKTGGENQQILFWKKVVPLYCKKIINYGKNAEEFTKNNKLLKNKKIFLQMINKNNVVAKKAIEERKKTLDFIKSYC